MNPQKLNEKTKNVQNFIHDKEFEYLFELARKNSDGVILEIGNYCGKSTLALAYGSKEGKGKPVFTIDPHLECGVFSQEDRINFYQNMVEYGVLDIVRPLEVFSHVPAANWEHEIGVLWIDGDHSYEGCKLDIKSWSPHVKLDGKIVFHDADKDHTGVPKVIDEIIKTDGYELCNEVRGIQVIRKNEDNEIY